MGLVLRKSSFEKKVRKIVRSALKEDLGRGDITTDAIVPAGAKVLGIIFPKEEGILCGINIARIVFEEVDKKIDFEAKMQDGDEFSLGMTIATIIGPAGSCLKAERTALNFLQQLSGIATLTHKFVRAVGDRIKIMDTRKTTPGLRILEKYAVKVGGGYNHRFGLYDMVLIKDNHIEIAGSITNAVNAVRINSKKKRLFIEVEVKTMDELREAIELGVNRVMLDNMNLEQIGQAIKLVRESKKKMEIEVSGGINLGNITKYAELDIDCISIGALTHSAPAIDIALKMKPIS
uniref:Probable nicotinate-nucleotide pyrophosphorylase [carboxylating] n=1 Tax=candidate division WOR-3 bacterium TaxID=2052148 RepID=A0A7C4TDU4_UNCW3